MRDAPSPESVLLAIAAQRRAGQHDSARQALVELASAYPNHPAVNYATACVHDYLGLERQAIPFYVAAIANGLAGDDLRGAYLGLGSTYRTLGMYAQAYETLQAGLEHFPDAPELQVFLAMALYNQREHISAMQIILHLLAETSTAPGIRQYARAIHFYADHLDTVWE
ncbi:MAG TPA: tetratricopeptide repeat protein [Anaerolineales bacterium]|nr:tetratricopeptide repeat protein [Anaerolineales bacterium]